MSTNNISRIILSGGQSATGSFNGVLALSTGSVLNPTASSQITGMTFVNGYDYKNVPQYSSISTSFNIPAGTKLELLVTAITLASGSAPVLLHG